ncbi:MAG: hypothetical protein CMJ36_04950 [Phycisphaerae bacterium]|nr:hypothetical protein [Phycisphaerae bacterium]
MQVQKKGHRGTKSRCSGRREERDCLWWREKGKGASCGPGLATKERIRGGMLPFAYLKKRGGDSRRSQEGAFMPSHADFMMPTMV